MNTYQILKSCVNTARCPSFSGEQCPMALGLNAVLSFRTVGIFAQKERSFSASMSECQRIWQISFHPVPFMQH